MEVAIVMVLYIGFTSILAFLTTRRNKTSKDFFIGSAGFGVVVIVAMTFSEVVGGTGTVGSASEAMSVIGMGAIWSTVGMAIGCFLFVLLLGRFYRVLSATRGVRSVASAYEVMFGTKTKVVVLVIVSVVYACLFALQPVAAADLLAPMFGIDRNLMFVAVGALFIAISCLGGLKGLANMNKVHAFVMWFGLFLVAILAVRAAGGPVALSEAAPNGFFNPFGPGLGTVVIWAVGAALSQMSSAVMAMITLSADSLEKAKKGVAVASVLTAVFAFFPALIGVAATVIVPESTAGSAIYSVASSISPWIGGLCSVAVIAAIFSTAPSLLLIVGTTLTEDLYKAFVNKRASEKQIMRAARIIMVIVGTFAVLLGSQTTSIFSELVNIFQIRSVVGVVLLVALLWPRVTDSAAFWSILIGGGLAAAWHFLGSPLGVQPLIPALISSMLVLVAVTCASKEKIGAPHRRYMTCEEEFETMKLQTV